MRRRLEGQQRQHVVDIGAHPRARGRGARPRRSGSRSRRSAGPAARRRTRLATAWVKSGAVDDDQHVGLVGDAPRRPSACTRRDDASAAAPSTAHDAHHGDVVRAGTGSSSPSACHGVRRRRPRSDRVRPGRSRSARISRRRAGRPIPRRRRGRSRAAALTHRCRLGGRRRRGTGRAGRPPRSSRADRARASSPLADRDAGEPGRARPGDRARADGRQVDAEVLARLRRLDQDAAASRAPQPSRAAARARRARAPSIRSVPSGPSTARTRWPRDHAAWPMSKADERGEQPRAERDAASLGLGRARSRP